MVVQSQFLLVGRIVEDGRPDPESRLEPCSMLAMSSSTTSIRWS